VPGVFGIVLAFGLTALGYGVGQMFTGRRSKRVIYLIVVLAAILVLLTYLLLSEICAHATHSRGLHARPFTALGPP
jgi:uncharacterized membrane protein YuzA (DUF378 family)